MKRFAANRVYDISSRTMHRNAVVEIEEVSHLVDRVFALDGEVSHVQWLGGLILLCCKEPVIEAGEDFKTFLQRIEQVESIYANERCSACHVTNFNVNAMEFTPTSRIRLLK